MKTDDILRKLADSVHSGTCVACVGAGVSAACSVNGDTFKGYPTGGALLDIMKKGRSYLDGYTSLTEAAYVLKSKEGRPALEQMLVEIYGARRRPLPTHGYLADLPFASYISFNFDTLLEKELASRNSNVLSVREDRDVCYLNNKVVSVVKPHGCVDLPRTMAIARDEVYSFEARVPIINHHMLSILANKTILFLGFSLSDQDLSNLFLYLKKALGEHMPRSTAVIGPLGNTQNKEFWKDNGVTLVTEDATHFLRELAARVHVMQYLLRAS